MYLFQICLVKKKKMSEIMFRLLNDVIFDKH